MRFSSRWSHLNPHQQDQLSFLLDIVCFIRPKLPLFFPPTHPFFFEDSEFLIKYPFIHMKSLHSFPSMFLSGDSQEDANGASSSSFFVLFYPMNSIQALPIISFPRCKYLLMPVHLIFSHFSLFNCSGVLKISRRFVFPLYIRSSSFEDVISFKSFNSTGEISLFNHSNGVFSWVGPNPHVFSQDLTWLF